MKGHYRTMNGLVGIIGSLFFLLVVFYIAYREINSFENEITEAVFEPKKENPMPGHLKMVSAETTTLAGDDSCIIVACYNDGADGIGSFWDYYKEFGYTVRKVKFKHMLAVGKQKTIAPWCRIPTVKQTLKHFPEARVLYLDLDTLVNPKIWCNLPDDKQHAPIVMNSLTRSDQWKHVQPDQYVVHGAQVQANAFIVTSGEYGMKAMDRWERSYDAKVVMADQGVIHVRENRLCGVPGWIQCYSNPSQQNCHCTGMKKEDKKSCIEKLFKGQREGCRIPAKEKFEIKRQKLI